MTATLEDIEGADAAIEAIVEDEQLKREVFARLDELLPDARFLASNTSSVPIMKLGAETRSTRAACSGMHFFNPVPVLPLVEIVTVDHDRARRPSTRRASSPRRRSASSASTPRTARASSSTRC